MRTHLLVCGALLTCTSLALADAPAPAPAPAASENQAAPTAPAPAADAAAVPAPAPTPAVPENADKADGKGQSAEQVIQELLQKRQEAPAVEPTHRPVNPAPVAGPVTNRKVIGTAPDAVPGKLLREGDYILSRRGRVAPAPDGKGTLFVFLADGSQTPETPLLLAPSALTEQVEKLAAARGDQPLYLATGRILTYQGANYLLPTQMMIDFDRGNLKP